MSRDLATCKKTEACQEGTGVQSMCSGQQPRSMKSHSVFGEVIKGGGGMKDCYSQRSSILCQASIFVSSIHLSLIRIPAR